MPRKLKVECSSPLSEEWKIDTAFYVDSTSDSLKEATRERFWEHLHTWADEPEPATPLSPTVIEAEQVITNHLHRLPGEFAQRWLLGHPHRLTYHISRLKITGILGAKDISFGVTPELLQKRYPEYRDFFNHLLDQFEAFLKQQRPISQYELIPHFEASSTVKTMARKFATSYIQQQAAAQHGKYPPDGNHPH